MPLRRIAGWLERVSDNPVMKWLVLCAVLVPMALSVAVSAQYYHLTAQVQQEQRNRDADQARQDKFVACVAAWADAYTARANTITRINVPADAASVQKDNALDTLIRTVAVRNQAQFDRALMVYLQASDNAKAAKAEVAKALKQNPIPDPPKFLCR